MRSQQATTFCRASAWRFAGESAGKRSTRRLMTPVELLARLSTLVPPPRYPLVRYHGLFAPSAKRRSAVVRRPDRPERRERTREKPSVT
ncbi:MAG TPA: transposase [Sorangium sp.]|nr:transposase [Sorangium sp.]